MLKSGWVNKPLGEVCTLQRGFDLPKHSRTDGEFPLISSSGEIDRIVDFKVNAPGVATGRSGSIGNVFFIEENYWPLNTVLYVKDFHGNDERFVYYLLKRFDLNKYATGAGVPTLNRNHVHDEIVAIPESKEEQTRIVAILDEAFANTSQAVANAEKNLANARELFDSYLNEVFTRKGEGWEEKTLGYFSKSVCTGPFGSMLHKSDYVSEGVPLVNPINISGHSIIPDSSKLIDAKTKKRLAGYVLSVGDVVVARRGEIGRCAAITEEQDGWICGTGCFFVTPSDKLNSEFLVYLLQSGVYREKLEAVATGATMKNLSNSALAELLITVPSIKAQEKLLEEFSDLIGKVEELEGVYRRKLAALAELKQALLQKAFTGELTVANHPHPQLSSQSHASPAIFNAISATVGDR